MQERFARCLATRFSIVGAMGRARVLWLALLVVAALVVSSCGGAKVSTPENVARAARPASGAAPWPAPPNPLELARKAGLESETHEFLSYHVHAHLDVFVNGQPSSGNPRDVLLTQHEDIVVTFGTASELPSPIPSAYSSTISSTCAPDC